MKKLLLVVLILLAIALSKDVIQTLVDLVFDSGL